MIKTKITIALAALLLVTGCQGQESSEKEQSAETELSSEQISGSQKQADNTLTLPAQYFNQVKEVGGKNVIQNYENILALVNKTYYLPDTYIPSDLVRADVEYSFGDAEVEKALLRQEAAVALEKMFTAADDDSIELYAVSGYRSYVRQEEVFNAEVERSGEEYALSVVAVPGQSEHQTGLAMDISARSVEFELTESLKDTAEGQWLAEHAHEYGFILRYPEGKEEITGYSFEPWHFRYVGTNIAQTIYDKKLTLEEYFEIVKEI
ncbi:M15 family metallopeptidase [Bacillus sp. AGMB 02131]|uniref:M15 family metallopeptidase n=1 Tax=Peribacillus faecalis TaxID=2772559 RepID=A0A927CY18_9BACI|nr:M15 family metallopeptidase [Peribacillus faecalis]MBD3109817.1 M15 family metallopeptidase [Peribacillus faecalis]